MTQLNMLVNLASVTVIFIKGSRPLTTQAFITCFHADTAIEPCNTICAACVWVHGIGLALFRHLKGFGRARLDTGIAFDIVVFLGYGCWMDTIYKNGTYEL